MRKIIPAIDLGTASARIACVDDQGRASVLENNWGELSTPDAVAIAGDHVVVGSQALHMWVNDQCCAVRGVKKWLGNSKYRFCQRSAVGLAAEIFREVKQGAETQLGCRLHEAVLTAPLRFGSLELHDLKEAAELAGLHVVHIVGELVATAVTLGSDRLPERGPLLVCNLGDGFCEMGMFALEPLTLMAFRGDAVGGQAWTERLVDLALERIDHDYRKERIYGQLYEDCEHAKVQLSRLDRVTLHVLAPERSASVEISRSEFEAVTEDLVQRFLSLGEETLSHAKPGLSWHEVDRIVLAGGAARLPRIAQVLRETSGREPLVLARPEQAVVLGAAILAGQQFREERTAVSAGSASVDSQDRGPQAQRPIKLDENVQFTVFRPKAVVPERWYPLLAFAHLTERRADAEADEPDPVQEVARQAKQILGEEEGNYLSLVEDSGQGIPRSGQITFVPDMPEVQFNPPRATFEWLESVHRQEFRLRAPRALDGRTCKGKLTVFWGSIILAELGLSLRVDSGYRSSSRKDAVESVQTSPFRRIFASYSHQDHAIVEQVEKLGVALGDRYLRDCHDLRAGEIWNDRLRELILEADIFQLFWSRAAMLSRYVRQEWEYALSLGRKNFLRPTYWEEPLPIDSAQDLPPEALQRLHFQRIYVYTHGGEDQPPPDDGGDDQPPPMGPFPSGIALASQRCTSFHLGVRVHNGHRMVNSVIVPKGTQLPTSFSRDFNIASQESMSVQIPVVEFEDSDGEYRLLGNYSISLPAPGRPDDGIVLTLGYDELGIATVNVRHAASLQELLVTTSMEYHELDEAHAAPPERSRCVVFAVDVSGSMSGMPIEMAKTEILDVVRRFLELPYGRVGLVAFGSQAEVLCEPTTNMERLAEAMKRLVPFGSTNLADGLRLAAERALRFPISAGSIVVVTDGFPDDPDAAMNAAADLRQKGLSLFVLGLRLGTVDAAFLRALADDMLIIDQEKMMADSFRRLLGLNVD